MATKTTELEIINVGTPVFTKTARGGYNSLEIAYKNLSFDGKVEGKKLVDFNDKAVFAFVQELKNGDRVTITQEKGEGDQYWKWVGATMADSTAGVAPKVSQPTSEGSPGTTGKTVGRVVGSNYATAEERDAKFKFEQVKHRQIGRQGCINSAIGILTSNSKPFSVDEVVDVASKLEKFVFEDEIPV